MRPSQGEKGEKNDGKKMGRTHSVRHGGVRRKARSENNERSTKREKYLEVLPFKNRFAIIENHHA